MTSPDDDDLDGCDLPFDVPDQVTEDGEQVACLVMFADVFGDDEAVRRRADDLRDWADAVEGA